MRKKLSPVPDDIIFFNRDVLDDPIRAIPTHVSVSIVVSTLIPFLPSTIPEKTTEERKYIYIQLYIYIYMNV